VVIEEQKAKSEYKRLPGFTLEVFLFISDYVKLEILLRLLNHKRFILLYLVPDYNLNGKKNIMEPAIGFLL